MIFRGISKKYRHIKRYRKIVEVLLKNGFGFAIEAMDLHQFIPLSKRLKKIDTSSPEEGRAKRLRKVLEELGPTFVKLGQLLSTRPDLIPVEYIEEFEKLQDEVPAMDFSDVVEVLNNSLPNSYSQYFSDLDSTPLASASIGQVHKAVLNSGQEVVVKVQRPNIKSTIETDIEIMLTLAQLMENRIFSDSFFDPVEVVNEFSEIITEELDYRIEAKNYKRFKRNFSEEEDVKVAKIYNDLTNKKVLTMEYIKGIGIKQVDSKIERKELAQVISDSFMKQILIDGFFHGDPHPGNILITCDYKLALIDFGVVGQLNRDDKEIIASLFISVIKKEVDGIVDALLELGMLTEEIDLKPFKRDFYKLLDRYHGVALEEIEIGVILNKILELAYCYKIKLPIEFILLGKSMVTIEGVVEKLDPEFNFIKSAQPFIKEILKQRYNPKRIASDLFSETKDFLEVLKKLPDDSKEVFELLKKDKLQVNMKHLELDRLISKLDIVINRLSVSIIVTALIIGSSLIMLSDRGTMLFGYPIIGVTGYIIAAFLGIWLVISILRSGRF